MVYADPSFKALVAETAAVGISDHRPLRVWIRWRDRPGMQAAALDSLAEQGVEE